MVKVEISLLDLSEDLMRVRSLEWKISRNESVQENSKRPKICHLPICSVKHLRSHIVWGSSDGREILVFGSFGETEVDKAH